MSLKKYFACLCNNSVLWLISEACKKIFSGTPLADNTKDAIVTKGDKCRFVTK